MKQKVLSRRSAVAKDLGTSKYRPRVVRDKKHYTRKGRKARDHQSGRGLPIDIYASSCYCIRRTLNPKKKEHPKWDRP
jgi:hypothetical protein